ncbi:MAG: dipeptidase [Bacillota bacterium]|jgi:membrane dipeptidase|nr:membrane dipeptidase [Bacillota bacterium]
MITIDLHCDLLWYLSEKGIEAFTEASEAQITKESWERGGPDLLVMAIYVDERHIPHQKEAQALKMAGIYWNLAATGCYTPVLQRKDLDMPGKKALLSIEGGAPLESEEDLYAFRALGVRMLSLCWNYQNHLATGCLEQYSGGLTLKGETLLKKAQDLGILLDVSHLSEGSFWDAVKVSRLPLIASHSNSYALKPHPRNLKDDAIKEIAKSGGVIGVNFCPGFLQNPSAPGVVEQVVYMAELVGPEYVGIGSDFLGIDNTVQGLEHIGRWMDLEHLLEKAGFAKAEREGILGGNFKRVLSEVL